MTKKTTDPVKLTYKQRAFLNALIEAKGDPAQAYLQVYQPTRDLTRSQLSDRGQKVLKRVKENRQVGELLQEYGLTLEKWSVGMLELMEATKPLVHQGEIKDWYPDNPNRFQAHKLLANILGIERQGATVNITDNRKQSIIVQVAAECDIPRLREEEKQEKIKLFEDLGKDQEFIDKVMAHD